MRVTVISVQAIIARRDEVTWTGEVRTAGSWMKHEEVNDFLFRLFNRVEPGDGLGLEALGYRLPSLSVGDILYWGGFAYKVMGVGFERLDPDKLVMGAVFDSLRPADSDDADVASMQAAFWRARAIELGAAEDEWRKWAAKA